MPSCDLNRGKRSRVFYPLISGSSLNRQTNTHLFLSLEPADFLHSLYKKTRNWSRLTSGTCGRSRASHSKPAEVGNKNISRGSRVQILRVELRSMLHSTHAKKNSRHDISQNKGIVAVVLSKPRFASVLRDNNSQQLLIFAFGRPWIQWKEWSRLLLAKQMRRTWQHRGCDFEKGTKVHIYFLSSSKEGREQL